MGWFMVIGYVILWLIYEMMNLIFFEFIVGVGEIYVEYDYDMILFVVDDYKEEDVYCQIVLCKKVDGVIIYGFGVNEY